MAPGQEGRAWVREDSSHEESRLRGHVQSLASTVEVPHLKCWLCIHFLCCFWRAANWFIGFLFCKCHCKSVYTGATLWHVTWSACMLSHSVTDERIDSTVWTAERNVSEVFGSAELKDKKQRKTSDTVIREKKKPSRISRPSLYLVTQLKWKTFFHMMSLHICSLAGDVRNECKDTNPPAVREETLTRKKTAGMPRSQQKSAISRKTVKIPFRYV